MPDWFTDNTSILLIITGLIVFSLFIFISVTFLRENENQAARKSLLISILIFSPYFIFSLYKPFFVIETILIVFPFFVCIVLLIPFKGLKYIDSALPKHKIDERDIMFSRRLLKKGDGRFENYYKRRPEHLKADEDFRKLPGLLNEGSTQFDKVLFAAADASFFTVDQLREAVDGPFSNAIAKIDPTKMSRFVKQWSKKLGALDVGITFLEDYHKYSHVGRGEDYGKEVELNHKFAIAFTVEMDQEFTSCGPQAPIVMESGQQYLNAATIAVQLAQCIRQLGYPARAHIDTNYRVVCPLVAKDAGLGEIGRMGLLMTAKQGPRVRIAVVTTDMPLLIDEPKIDKSMIHFCGLCKKCADVCPSNSISFDKREVIDGVERWQINSDTCFHFWCKAGTDCGRCMACCPYAHPDNLMHNFIRFGIRNNVLFRKLAVVLDDYFYGKYPKPKKIPEWMNTK